VRSGRTMSMMISILVALLLASCGGGGNDDTPAETGSTDTRPSSPAKLSIVDPKVGQVVEGLSVDLRVKLKDAKLVPTTTMDIVPDEGHLHVLLDDQLISMTEGLEQTIPDVSPGPHRIQVEFVASDHAPFDPRVVALVTFEVKP
jgi:hypothetical protein